MRVDVNGVCNHLAAGILQVIASLGLHEVHRKELECHQTDYVERQIHLQGGIIPARKIIKLLVGT